MFFIVVAVYRKILGAVREILCMGEPRREAESHECFCYKIGLELHAQHLDLLKS